jgi:hypothetical protein
MKIIAAIIACFLLTSCAMQIPLGEEGRLGSVLVKVNVAYLPPELPQMHSAWKDK